MSDKKLTTRELRKAISEGDVINTSVEITDEVLMKRDKDAFNGGFEAGIDCAKECMAAAEEMAKALKAQHDALDMCFAWLAQRDPTFFPSKSGQPWDAMKQGNTALAAWQTVNTR